MLVLRDRFFNAHSGLFRGLDTNTAMLQPSLVCYCFSPSTVSRSHTNETLEHGNSHRSKNSLWPPTFGAQIFAQESLIQPSYLYQWSSGRDVGEALQTNRIVRVEGCASWVFDRLFRVVGFFDVIYYYRHSLISVEYFRPIRYTIVDRDPPDMRVTYSRPAV